ncbi:MAG: UTP--glucose-1-phosphate uridylyltransferase [Solirubrobacterales bacterium]|nr:UTP--glucose-1-phosphate uridylyltransferase [Solirubrobacterales bacterium]MBV9471903.1 UTP--glucose-1-phosphate uridylyltransferase [Solirubrobacterales bacterium]
MSGTEDGLRAAEQKMRRSGQPEEAVRAFASAYERLVAGETGLLPSDELEPAEGVRALDELSGSDEGRGLEKVAAIKLNGGLATTMGLQQPKSLVKAREDRSFLEIIIGQTLALRELHRVRLPLVLMNSEVTRERTLAALAEHPELEVQGIPPDFMQSMIPKLEADSLAPIEWPDDPSLEWCPPGHGDIYGALRSSGMLEALLEHGFEHAMISNSDNLGATLDPRIAAFVAAERIPFLMEVVQGTEADRKGGHIASRREDGQLVLREVAQTPEEDEESFRDYRRWRYYNTNNLWVDLRALADRLERSDGVLELPLIVNRKTVDPRDSSSPAVVQLESAMGAAIGSFPEARLLCVPRSRFVPVKTTDDLLVLRSDVYTISDDVQVQPIPEREGRLPYVELDSRFYKLLDGFEDRFPDGAPSLREAERLVVEGDVTFGAGVVVKGSVQIETREPTRIEPETVLSG